MISVFVPILAILAPTQGCFIAVFFLPGVSMTLVGGSHHAMAIALAPADGAGKYLGMFNTLRGPIFIIAVSVVGPLIAELASYQVLFAVSAIVSAAAAAFFPVALGLKRSSTEGR